MKIAALVALSLFLAGCGPKLPPLPEIDFAPYPPAVRAAVEQAHADAEFTPGDAIRVAQLAKVLHAHGLLEPAIVYYKRARELDPQNAVYPHLLGLALASRGDYPGAIDALNAAAGLNSNAKPTRLALAQVLLTSGATVEAGNLFRALGDHPVALLGLGQTLQGAGQLEVLRKAVTLEPRYGDAWKALAAAYRAHGDSVRAEEAERAQGRYLRFPVSTGDAEFTAVRDMDLTAAGLLARAERAEAGVRLLDAARLYEQVSASEPDDDQVSARLARIYVQLKDQPAAEKVLRSALLRKPESAALATAEGLLLAATQRRAEAKPYFEKAVAADAAQADAWYELGRMAAEAGEAQRALDLLARAVYADPGHRPARYQAGVILAAHRKLDLAREQLEPLSRGPEDEWTAKARQALGQLSATKAPAAR